MIYSRQVANVMAIKDYLPCQFVHVLFNFIMLHHDHNEVSLGEKTIQIMVLILDHVLFNPRVVDFQRLSQMFLLIIQKLEGRALAEVVREIVRNNIEIT